MSEDSKFGISDSVFDGRRGNSVRSNDVVLSVPVYYIAILAGVVAGYAVMVGTAVSLRGWLPNTVLAYVLLLVGVLVSMIAGSILANKSSNWAVSLFAYLALVSAPFGALFGPFVNQVGVSNIVLAIAITAVATVILGIVGLSIKTDLSYSAFNDVITGGLFLFAFLSLVTVKLQLHSPVFYIILACVGIVIFAFLLVLDFNRSKYIPTTLDDAVDSSLAIFLDSLNIVVRIAGLLSKLKK